MIGAMHLLGDLAHALEVAGRGNWEAGLDHIDTQRLERMGHLELLGKVHTAAGALLTVAQRGVEH